MTSKQAYNRIGNLKVHSESGDSPALRMQLGNTLSSLELRPTGMPPSAILIVRKLHDPLPGVLKAESGNRYRPGKHGRVTWQNALNVRMSELYRKAGRPAKMALVGEQEAVLFADHAELLACFCRDIVRGRASQWWWRSHFAEYLNAMAPAEAASRLMMDSPRAVPAVISLLASWRCAIELVKTIDACIARQMIGAVLHEFGLADLDEKLRVCESADQRRENVGTAQTASRSFVDGPDRAVETGLAAFAGERDILPDPGIDAGHCQALPWLGFFSDEISEPGFSKEQLGLIGLARLLQDAAMILRTDEFQRRVVDWWSSSDRDDMRSRGSGIPSILQNRARMDRLRQRVRMNRSAHDARSASTITFADPGNDSHSAPEEAPGTMPAAGSSESTVASNPEPAEHSRATDSPERGAPATQQEAQQVVQGETGFDESIAASPATAKPGDDEQAASEITGHRSLQQKAIAEPDTASATDDGSDIVDDVAGVADVNGFFADTFFETRLGGLFYLINLLAQLELPQRLAAEWRLDQQISRWALLDAIARALLGKYYRAYSRDPVWRVLAGLDQRRRNTAVGKGFRCPSDYLMPERWLQYLTDGVSPEFYWAVHNKRLRIWCDIGLVAEGSIADPRRGESQAVAALQRYQPDVEPQRIQTGRFARAPVANRKQLEALGIDKELTRLLAYVLPPVRRYLQHILALSAASPHALLNTLLGFDGRIFVSSSHIDMVAGITSTSCQVRRSGLDQDPGWLPDYGRVVLFHFY